MKKITYTLVLTLLFAPSILVSQDIDLVSFATGFDRPVEIKHANDSRLFVLEQDGIIKILDASGNVNATNFLDIDARVRSTGNEQGLLGLAFDPNYATNNRFYLNYINNAGDTVIARFLTSANPDVADDTSEEILLTISQPYANHNGGSMAFGTDGLLYIALGDGGNGGDPQNFAQNLQSLLGKILRIDVSGVSGYTIPSTNPYVGNSNGLDEIWSYGLRNPWKMSFDSDNGELWIGDVGQSNKEEVNNVTIIDAGYNFGWRCYEGNSTFNTSGCPAASTTTFPVSEYNYGNNSNTTPFRCSITGGYLYRGSDYPNLQGKYIFADYCSAEIITLTENGNTWDMAFTSSSANSLSTFGEDQNQELYVAALSGTIYRVVDTSTLSLDENNLSSNITLYPNPANSFFRLDVDNNASQLQIVKILSLSGKTVLEITLDSNTQDIDIQNLSNGIYIVEVIDRNNNRAYKKLIIN